MKELAVVLDEIAIEDGIIPFELDYTLQPVRFFDETKLIYDDWNTLDFWVNKMPKDLLVQFPEIIDVVEQFALSRKGITPLMELEERAKKRQPKTDVYDI
jgi:hypothetical protein